MRVAGEKVGTTASLKTGPKLIVVMGLPGSGKTFYSKRLMKSGLRCFDDFHADADGDSIEVAASPDWPDLKESLKTGVDAVVGDIAFCEPSRRAALMEAVRAEVPSVQIEYLAFENNPARCLENLINVADSDHRIAKLSEWAPRYVLPEGAIVMPIKYAGSTPESASPGDAPDKAGSVESS
jgi:hypothetical protein